jgi:hypothetical protein
MKRALQTIKFSIALALCGLGATALPLCGQDIEVSFSGTTYDITTITGTGTALGSILSTQPWFDGVGVVAGDFADLVGPSLGSPNGSIGGVTDVGPLFAFGPQEADFYGTDPMFSITGTWYASPSDSDTYTYAIEARVPDQTTTAPLAAFGFLCLVGLSRWLRWSRA